MPGAAFSGEAQVNRQRWLRFFRRGKFALTTAFKRCVARPWFVPQPRCAGPAKLVLSLSFAARL